LSKAQSDNELQTRSHLSILLSGLTIVFLLATATLRPFGLYAGAPLGSWSW